MYLVREGGRLSHRNRRNFPDILLLEEKSVNDSSSLLPWERDGTNSTLTACHKSNKRVTLDASRGGVGRGRPREERLDHFLQIILDPPEQEK